jgi:hypothetical protein
MALVGRSVQHVGQNGQTDAVRYRSIRQDHVLGAAKKEHRSQRATIVRPDEKLGRDARFRVPRRGCLTMTSANRVLAYTTYGLYWSHSGHIHGASEVDVVMYPTPPVEGVFVR